MLTLYRYRLARDSSGRLFVYGYDRRTADVRIVELRSFDEVSLTGRAQDETTVVLDGVPALDMNAGALWIYYCAEHDIGECEDITPTGGLATP